MRHRWISALLILALAACHNGGPTEPAQSSDLTGIWTATIAFGDTACGAAESVSAVVTQYPNSLIVYIHTKCYGALSFTGNGTQNRVNGKILFACGTPSSPYSDVPSVEASGSGTLDAKHISLEIAPASNKACAFPGATIDLTR
jgi:hypothetical protein